MTMNKDSSNNLKNCRTYGFTLLQLMSLLAAVGMVVTVALQYWK